MAVTWTKESTETTTAATLAWTMQKAYDFMGFLVDDMPHATYNTTDPWGSFIYDMMNDAIQTIQWHVPAVYSIISCTTESGMSVYPLPDYALGTGYIYWVTYDGDRIYNINDESVMSAEVDDIDEDSFTATGTVKRYMDDGDRFIRLIPIANDTKTLRVKVAVMPTAVAALATVLPLPAQLNKAPSMYVASFIALKQNKAELSKQLMDGFWQMVQKAKVENTPAVDAPLEAMPGKSWKAPGFSGDDQ